MKRSLIFLILSLLILSVFSACHKGASTDTESQKPAQNTPQESEAEPEEELGRYDKDGVIRIADRRIFNAVLPYTAEEIGCFDEFCEFYTDLNREELVRFFLKYFPTQKFEEYPKSNRIFLQKASIQRNDPMVRAEMQKDSAVILPLEGLSVEIKAYWVREKIGFRLVYLNPSYKEAFQVPEEVREARQQLEALGPNADPHKIEELTNLIENDGRPLEDNGQIQNARPELPANHEK